MYSVYEAVRDARKDTDWRDDTDAIHSVIVDVTALPGGGTVYFPRLRAWKVRSWPFFRGSHRRRPNRYMIDTSKSIVLKSNVRLHFAKGAVLEACATDSEEICPIIMNDEDACDVQITGRGTIRGERHKHVVRQFEAKIQHGVVLVEKSVAASGELTCYYFHDVQGVTPTTKGGANVVISGAGPKGSDLHTRITHRKLKDNPTTNVWALEHFVNSSLVDSTLVVTPLPGEAGIGILLRGVQRFLLEGFTVEKCWGDGILIRGTQNKNGNELRQSTDGVIHDVVARNNRRSNLSIIDAERIVVLAGTYRRAGSPVRLTPLPATADYKKPIVKVVDSGAIGTRCGIHLEPDVPSNRSVRRVVIAHTKTARNAYDGIHMANPAVSDVWLHHNRCSGNGASATVRNTHTAKALEIPGSGIAMHGAENVTIDRRNRCRCNKVGLRVREAGGGPTNGPWVSGNSFCCNKDAAVAVDGNVPSLVRKDNRCDPGS